ncbi:MAG TPA: ABC transporter permease, partial [Roseateles sp.]|nr:ABC transporter permease [Roseateles sp.]
MSWLARIGGALRQQLVDIGWSTRLFLQMLARSGTALLRFGLVREQVFFLGNRSLSIIGVSGLFVG